MMRNVDLVELKDLRSDGYVPYLDHFNVSLLILVLILHQFLCNLPCEAGWGKR